MCFSTVMKDAYHLGSTVYPKGSNNLLLVALGFLLLLQRKHINDVLILENNVLWSHGFPQVLCPTVHILTAKYA